MVQSFPGVDKSIKMDSLFESPAEGPKKEGNGNRIGYYLSPYGLQKPPVQNIQCIIKDGHCHGTVSCCDDLYSVAWKRYNEEMNKWFVENGPA